MSAQYLRASMTLLGTSTLLLVSLAQAQPAQEQAAQPQPAPAQSAQDAAAPQEPAQPQMAQPEVVPQPQPPASEMVLAPPPMPLDPVPVRTDDGPQVLFPAGTKTKVSGFGAIDLAYTRLADKNASLICGSGSVLLARTLSIGVMGCGVPTRINGENYGNVIHETGDRLEVGYGGVVAAYHFFPKKIYNLSLSAMVGGGGAAIVNERDRNNESDDDWNDDSEDHVKRTDALFVAEPRLNGYVNLTRWMRVGAFAGYRFVSGVNLKNLESKDLSGPVAGGTMQFGWF